MRFKQWLNESGHILMNNISNITVLYHGKPLTLHGVDMIDPRFEFSNYPPAPGSNAKKFLGEIDFSLPLIGPNGNITMYICSQRRSIMSGNGFISIKPVGYVVKDLHWAEKAQFVGSDGRAIDLDGVSQQAMAG